MPRYIIFTGPSQSGKSTAAQMLATALLLQPCIVIRRSFDGPMRSYMAALLGRAVKTDDPLPELLSKTPRDFMRLEASHMRFNYGPSVMGNLLKARVDCLSQTPDFVVVDDGASILDCRALGEYMLISITRRRSERVFPFMIPGAKVFIRNDGTIADLKLKIDKIARECMK